MTVRTSGFTVDYGPADPTKLRLHSILVFSVYLGGCMTAYPLKILTKTLPLVYDADYDSCIEERRSLS